MEIDWVARALFGTGVFVSVGTVLPLWQTTRWWVRIWDFPRFQLSLIALVIAVLMAVRSPMNLADWVLFVVMLAVAAWQSTWIGPYLPFAPCQMKSCHGDTPSTNRIRLMTTNVLQTSREANSLIKIVRQAAPDLLLAVEVDEWWLERLTSGLTSMLPYRIAHPLSNGYGIALFSRLELVEPEIRFVADEAVPSIRSIIRLRSGEGITVYGVHPQPPAIMQDTTERDVELMRIALEIKTRGIAAIVLGDLNDVAWSPTTNRFTRAGNLLDPRRGRGFFNTYPARWPGLRYPLDYIFSTRHFEICSMKVLPEFGSDHLPLLAEFYLQKSIESPS
jgi:endonuclease/exonuclease/phosphatase (EEP) superfamily protein YafD